MEHGSILWNPSHRLVLASKSATRRHLLASAGLPFETDAAEIDERAVENAFVDLGGAGEELPIVLARAKALDVSRRHPGALCVGADQILSLDGRIFHKAATLRDAGSALARLSGRTHRLTSAFAIARDGRLAAQGVDRAEMTMRPLDATQIDLYLRSVGEAALTSVGAYQLENYGVHLFEAIQGDHSTILGLPMLPLLDCLRREGALAL